MIFRKLGNEKDLATRSTVAPVPQCIAKGIQALNRYHPSVECLEGSFIFEEERVLEQRSNKELLKLP
jgi:hypothetical protein